MARDLVVLNAAAALHVRTGDGWLDCAARARSAIDDGAALARLGALIAVSEAGGSATHAAQDATQDVAQDAAHGAAQPVEGAAS